MRRRSRRASYRSSRILRRRRFDLRRWVANAPPRQFLVVIFVGVPFAFIVTSLLTPYLLAAGIVLAFLLGLLFMKVGGLVIGFVSILDRTDEYDAPLWFPYFKWVTAPMRIIDCSISLHEMVFDQWKNR